MKDNTVKNKKVVTLRTRIDENIAAKVFELSEKNLINASDFLRMAIAREVERQEKRGGL
jgi:predicted transcriptional regulator